MQEGNPYYNLYNNDGGAAAAAAAYSYASAGGGTGGSSCAKDYKDYNSYYGTYFNQAGHRDCSTHSCSSRPLAYEII